MKIKAILLAAALLMVLSGCGNAGGVQNLGQATTQTGQATTQAGQATVQATTPDVVSSASIVDNNAAFEKAISSSGTWIIAVTKDITEDKDITLDGEFKDEKGAIHRKVALYAQDANRNITARYTLTAPKFTINSPSGSLEHGTFKGDVYVAAKDFKLIDNTVEGNVYFLNDEAKNTFTMDQTSKITGVQELKK